jgi:hypothetical protein
MNELESFVYDTGRFILEHKGEYHHAGYPIYVLIKQQ